MGKPLDCTPPASAEKELVAILCRGEAESYRLLYERFAPAVDAHSAAHLFGIPLACGCRPPSLVVFQN